MTAQIETIITCDGGPECPQDQAYGVGSVTQLSAKQQRAGYWKDGWVYRNGKDYCSACASSRGLQASKQQSAGD